MQTRYIVIVTSSGYFYFLSNVGTLNNDINVAKICESYEEAKSCAEWYSNYWGGPGIASDRIVVSADMHPEDRYAD